MKKNTKEIIRKKIFKTFNEWSSEGYTINKGSKAVWINNVAKFDKSQVSKRFSRTRASFWESYDPRDGDADFENGYDDDDEMGFNINDFGNN